MYSICVEQTVCLQKILHCVQNDKLKNVPCHSKHSEEFSSHKIQPAWGRPSFEEDFHCVQNNKLTAFEKRFSSGPVRDKCW